MINSLPNFGQWRDSLEEAEAILTTLLDSAELLSQNGDIPKRYVVLLSMALEKVNSCNELFNTEPSDS